MKSLENLTQDERRLLHALAFMCVQYIGGLDDNDEYRGLDHECISAGEEAAKLLVEYGLLSPSGRGGNWTELGLWFLDEDL